MAVWQSMLRTAVRAGSMGNRGTSCSRVGAEFPPVPSYFRESCSGNPPRVSWFARAKRKLRLAYRSDGIERGAVDPLHDGEREEAGKRQRCALRRQPTITLSESKSHWRQKTCDSCGASGEGATLAVPSPAGYAESGARSRPTGLLLPTQCFPQLPAKWLNRLSRETTILALTKGTFCRHDAVRLPEKGLGGRNEWRTG
jgi:hypothetical protein